MDEESISRSIDTSIRSYKMLGLILIVLGAVGILAPLFVGGLVMYLIAFALILVGGMYLGMAVYGDTKKGATWGKALVFLAIGLLMIIYPYHALAGIALIMGVFFILGGIMALILAFAVDSGKTMLFVDAIVGIILGVLLFVGWPESSTWMVGIYLGLFLLMEGIAMMSVGYYIQGIRE